MNDIINNTLGNRIMGRNIVTTENPTAILRYKAGILQQAWSIDRGNGLGEVEWRDVPKEE